MQLSVLREGTPLLQEYMQKQNFSLSYTKRHVQLSGFIIKRADLYNWKTLEDVLSWFQIQPYSERYLTDVRKLLFNYEFFFVHNCFPGNGSIKRDLLFQAPSLGSLDMRYLHDHLDELISYMKKHDYSESSIRRLRFIANRIIVLFRHNHSGF